MDIDGAYGCVISSLSQNYLSSEAMAAFKESLSAGLKYNGVAIVQFSPCNFLCVMLRLLDGNPCLLVQAHVGI